MVYIPLHETWYCIECQEKDLIWYHSHGSEEDRRQHDYINYYLEQKENLILNQTKINIPINISNLQSHHPKKSKLNILPIKRTSKPLPNS